jgi:hypothetical protein
MNGEDPKRNFDGTLSGLEREKQSPEQYVKEAERTEREIVTMVTLIRNTLEELSANMDFIKDARGELDPQAVQDMINEVGDLQEKLRGVRQYLYELLEKTPGQEDMPHMPQ